MAARTSSERMPREAMARSTIASRLRAKSAPLTLLHRDLSDARRLTFRQRQRKDAVLVVRLGLRCVDVLMKRESAELLAVVAFAADHRLALLLFFLSLHLGTDRDAVAVDRDLDVVLLDARDLGLDDERLVVFGYVHRDLRLLGQVAHEPLREPEHVVEVAERVEASELGEGIDACKICHVPPLDWFASAGMGWCRRGRGPAPGF